VPYDRVYGSESEDSENATQTAYWLLTIPLKDVDNTREIFYERRKVRDLCLESLRKPFGDIVRQDVTITV
jgi:hypothetical protein